MTVSGGIATFTDLSDNKAETISLQFTSVPVLTAATSNNIVVSPAAATQLVLSTQPSPTATAGVAFSTQPVIYVEDQYGNLETGDNTTHVTAASLPLGSGPLQGTTTVTAAAGIADVHQSGGQQGRDDLASLLECPGSHRRRRPTTSWSAPRRPVSWR